MKPTKWLLSAVCVALLLLLTGCSREKDLLDVEVRRLCAIDGGTKVYETVALPTDDFDSRGLVKGFDFQTGQIPVDPGYVAVRTIQYYKSGNPEFVRMHFKITRNSDGKLMGESALYGRRGGDLPGPWEPSHFACPSDTSIGTALLVKTIFLAEQGSAQ